MKCRIQWVDSKGNPTPDENPAIGEVQREAYRYPYPTAVNGCIEYTETEWFPICADHARQLPIAHWTFRPITPGKAS